MDAYVYQCKKLLFEENKDNLEAEASKLRKLTALNFLGGIKCGEDNAFICDLLKRDLEAYSNVVDDPNGVNNYVKQVLDVLPNNLSGNQNQWKSSLTTAKIAEMLSPLPCSQDQPGSWDKVNCVKSKLTDADVKAIHSARERFKNNHPFEPEKRRKNPQNVFLSSEQSNPSNKSGPAVQSKPLVSTFNPKPSFQPKNVFAKPQGARETAQPKSSVPHTGATAPPKPGFFKTAGEELRQQNLKKYGKDNGGASRGGQSSYGAVKKSLGARGGGVHGKFQPPILRNEDEETGERQRRSDGAENEGEVDERLKNIDPKMIEVIQNEIMDVGPKLTWDDIAGLEFAKNTIQEVVVWPMLRPDIFTGLRRPPRGILLFGPPGTGKTLIGKCIASQSGATFLSISASSLTSKWVGDGEKMVRALFAVARVYQPSVVFIDEIDSLLSQRSDTEHESSRRIKTEFLVQLDGVGTGDEDRILIIGATNRPQELDEAARRRLVKRLYIPLPETNARAEIVRNLISNERHTLTDCDVVQVAELTEGYSGADMKHVCQEASLGPIRSIPPMQIRDIDTSQVRPVSFLDFQSALTRVKSTVSPKDLHNYLEWDHQFGCSTV